MTLLPTVFEKTFQFMRRLDSFAKTEKDFPLGELLTDLTFDIIGVVSMDVDFGAQLDEAHQSDYIHAYKALLAEFEDIDYSLPRPGRAVRRWWKTRKMDRLLTGLVKAKLTEYRQLGADNKSRSIISLASQGSGPLTQDMLQVVVDQVKSFMFAGHDTTSITMQWAFYELSRHPRVLEAVRAELDAVFGADLEPSIVREKFLAGGDEIMVRLAYTSAVIKEVLRLYPPAGSARMSRPGKGWKLRMPDTGREIDVDGCVLYNCHTIIQRDPAVYGETANNFVPERWLDDADVSSTTKAESDDRPGNKVPATAWRPFERGPRNCIGQDFANIEAKVILACAARRYDFTKVGLGELVLDANGRPILNAKGAYEVKSRVYNVSGEMDWNLVDQWVELTAGTDETTDGSADRQDEDEGPVEPQGVSCLLSRVTTTAHI
jgi:cytochrome P450